MTNITDWLMVLITFIYALVTFFILLANNSSAKASKDELAEFKRQFDEDNRARIEYEFCYVQRTWYIVRFVNHGKKTAYHVKIELDDGFIESIPRNEFQEILRNQKNKEVIIGVGQHYDLFISDNSLRGNSNLMPLTGRLSYQDKKKYKCEIFIDLEGYATFFSSASDEERLVNEIKRINEEIKNLRKTVENLCVKKDFGEDKPQRKINKTRRKR